MVTSNKDSMAEKPLTSVMEDYLEAIHLLELDQGNVRIKDIAEKA